jgi:hypothetical protein
MEYRSLTLNFETRMWRLTQLIGIWMRPCQTVLLLVHRRLGAMAKKPEILQNVTTRMTMCVQPSYKPDLELVASCARIYCLSKAHVQY